MTYISGLTDLESLIVTYISGFTDLESLIVTYISGLTYLESLIVTYISGITDLESLIEGVFCIFMGFDVVRMIMSKIQCFVMIVYNDVL